jgi:8-oxo-dGTP pyrophosphatase MutT (NUDIX family)
VYWKLPGGRTRPGEDPAYAAVREAGEEIGAFFNREDLRMLSIEDRRDHDSVVYQVHLNWKRFKAIGDEGEEVQVFSPVEILQMRDFFGAHRRAIWPELRALCGERAATAAA